MDSRQRDSHALGERVVLGMTGVAVGEDGGVRDEVGEALETGEAVGGRGGECGGER